MLNIIETGMQLLAVTMTGSQSRGTKRGETGLEIRIR
jgi:hypothetical protein